MAKGAAPSQDQLLELLKRAAEELKHAQEEARTAVHALQKEQAAHQKTEAELEAALTKAKGAQSQENTDQELLQDQISAERENGKLLDQRVKELEAALEGALSERETLRAKVTESEAAASAALAQQQGKLDALRGGEQNAIEAAVAEQKAKLAELERQLKEAEGHHTAMIDDAAGKLVQAEAAAAQEREKHQATAQKLLETRSKVRELEASVANESERVKGLEVAAQQLADGHAAEARELTLAHEAALKKISDDHTAQIASLQQGHLAMQTELTQVTARWREVEHQYEALHREMLLTLEQRDEARRMLENERQERERLQRALQGQHR